MTRQFSTSVDLCSCYDENEVKIRILDQFLFIEAEQKRGLKGVNFTSSNYKSCRRLRKTVDIENLKAFYDGHFVRFTINDNKQSDETELVIDKRRARRPKPAPAPVYDRKKQENYERFMAALKEIHMI